MLHFLLSQYPKGACCYDVESSLVDAAFSWLIPPTQALIANDESCTQSSHWYQPIRRLPTDCPATLIIFPTKPKKHCHPNKSQNSCLEFLILIYLTQITFRISFCPVVVLKLEREQSYFQEGNGVFTCFTWRQMLDPRLYSYWTWFLFLLLTREPLSACAVYKYYLPNLFNITESPSWSVLFMSVHRVYSNA